MIRTRNLYILLQQYSNKKITDQIQNFLKNDSKIIQWGGYKQLYQNYKSHYLKMKGGTVNFAQLSPNSHEILPFNLAKPLSQPHKYTTNQINYIKHFFNKVIVNVKCNGFYFTHANIADSKVMGCGSFGCSVLINNTGANKKYVVKLIGGSSGGHVNYDNEIKSYLKETMIGYHVTQYKLPNFNKTYAYFKSSKFSHDDYFSSSDSSIEYTLVKDAGVNNNNQHTIIKNGKIFILLIDAGTSALTDLISTMKSSYGVAITQQNRIEILNKLEIIFEQMMNISKSSYHSVPSDRTVYLTHNDIKLPNMIFRVTQNKYDMEFIDYGGCVFSQTFFTTPEIFTRAYFNLVHGNAYNLYITSPLYDIGSVIYAMLEMFDMNINILKINISDMLVAYTSVPIDLMRITRTLQSITNLCKTHVSNKIFDIPNSINVNKIIGKLMIYVNFLGCIRRFMILNKNELITASGTAYKNIDFRNFELIEMSNTFPIVAKSIITFPNLSGFDLLEKVVDTVNFNVKYSNFV